MVVARFTLDEKKLTASLRLDGHAGQNVIGSDIVCAAASILAYTLGQCVKTAHTRGILKCSTVKMKSGDCIITCRAKDTESYAEMLHTYLVIQTGYLLLAHNYPQYVALKMFGEDTGKDD